MKHHPQSGSATYHGLLVVMLAGGLVVVHALLAGVAVAVWVAVLVADAGQLGVARAGQVAGVAQHLLPLLVRLVRCNTAQSAIRISSNKLGFGNQGRVKLR